MFWEDDEPRDLRGIRSRARRLAGTNGDSLEQGVVPIGLFALFVASLRTGGWESLQGIRPLPELVAFGMTIFVFWSLVGISLWRHGSTRERLPMSFREILQWGFVWGGIITAVGVTLFYQEGMIVDAANVLAAASCAWMYFYKRRKRRFWPYSVSLSLLFGCMAILQISVENTYMQSLATGLLVSMGVTCVLGVVLERVKGEIAYGSA